ncbi:hypothetical protein Q3G72_024303 [Acer saccharum]|nr:hypothetical protein Q3G72_024303 [Acer saccharum]
MQGVMEDGGNPGLAGIGGVLRDSNGKILGLFSLHLGLLDAISAEVHAILKACVLCVQTPELRMNSVVIVSDSRQAVYWVDGGGIINSNCVQAICEIKRLLALLGNTMVLYIPRASNTLADILAKKGSGTEAETQVGEFW